MRPSRTRPGGSGTIGEALANVLKRVDPEHRLPAYGVWTFWDEVVGETIARRAQPTGFRNGILVVTVSDHAWMHELQYMKQEICGRLNARLGREEIADMYLVTGSVPPPSPAAAPPTERRLDPGPSGGLVALPPLGDSALAGALARLVEARARRIARGRE